MCERAGARAGLSGAAVVGLTLLQAWLGGAWARADGTARFGGFSEDGNTYLVGDRMVCEALRIEPSERASGPAPTATPITTAIDREPSCATATSERIAAAKFQPGARQSGRDGFRVEPFGHTLRIRAPDRAGGAAAANDAPVAIYDAGAAVGRVTGVYLSSAGNALAIEYETRQGSRTERRVVGLRFADAHGAARPAAAGAEPSPRAPPPPATAARPSTPEERASTRAAALGALKKRRWRAAISACRAALDLAPGDLELRYGLAVALARTKDTAGALAELTALAAHKSDEKVVWLFDARDDTAFKQMRKEPAFRKLVGLEADPAAPRSAYERVLDAGGKWEQEQIRCEQARAMLALERRPREFSLRIESKCNGVSDILRLAGTWDTEGENLLLLTFPNDEGPDEQARCQIAACAESPGSSGAEDCVTCSLDQDLTMKLRPVRR